MELYSAMSPPPESSAWSSRLLGLDWANKSGDGAICRTCGFIHTFLEGALEWRRPTPPTAG